MNARSYSYIALVVSRLATSVAPILLLLTAVSLTFGCRQSVVGPSFDEVETEVARLLKDGDQAEAEALLDAAIDLHRQASPSESPDSKKLKERLQGLRTLPPEKSKLEGPADSAKAVKEPKTDLAVPPAAPRAPFRPDRYPFLDKQPAGLFGKTIDLVQIGIIAASSIAAVCLIGLIVMLLKSRHSSPVTDRPKTPAFREESFSEHDSGRYSGLTQHNPDQYEMLMDRPTVWPSSDLRKLMPHDGDSAPAATDDQEPALAPASASNAAWMLRWTDESGAPHAVTFDPVDLARSGNRLVIGRSPAMAQLIIGLSNVSRRHAELFLEENQLYIRDLDSGNGTFVNGQPLGGARRSALLRPGDRISLGKHVDVQLTLR